MYHVDRAKMCASSSFARPPEKSILAPGTAVVGLTSGSECDRSGQSRRKRLAMVESREWRRGFAQAKLDQSETGPLSCPRQKCLGGLTGPLPTPQVPACRSANCSACDSDRS